MRPHRPDPLSLTFGIIFLAGGGLLLADGIDLAARLRWTGPAVLIAVALVMLASASLGWRSDRRAAARASQDPDEVA